MAFPTPPRSRSATAACTEFSQTLISCSVAFETNLAHFENLCVENAVSLLESQHPPDLEGKGAELQAGSGRPVLASDHFIRAARVGISPRLLQATRCVA